MSDYIYQAIVIAEHEDDLTKKAVANSLAAAVDPDPYWDSNNYTEANWVKLEDSEGKVTAWGCEFLARAAFVVTADDFNSSPPTYPTIPGADESTIDFARSYVTVAYTPRGTGEEDHQYFVDTYTAMGYSKYEGV